MPLVPAFSFRLLIRIPVLPVALNIAVAPSVDSMIVPVPEPKTAWLSSRIIVFSNDRHYIC